MCMKPLHKAGRRGGVTSARYGDIVVYMPLCLVMDTWTVHMLFYTPERMKGDLAHICKYKT